MSSFAVVDQVGDVYVWGVNYHGNLGVEGDSTFATADPIKVTGAEGMKSVTSTFYDNCAVKAADGSVYCWGSNANKMFGDEPTTFSTHIPTKIQGTGEGEFVFERVFNGRNGYYAVTASGALYGWGNLPASYDQPAPMTLIDSSPVVDVAGAAYLRANGELYAQQKVTGNDWESLDDFQLIATDVVRFDNRFDTLCVITASGEVKCMGYNNMGQAGVQDHDVNFVAVWTTIDGLPSDPEYLSMQYDQACAIMRSTDVWCWGDTDEDTYEYSTDTDTEVEQPAKKIVGMFPAEAFSSFRRDTLITASGAFGYPDDGSWIFKTRNFPRIGYCEAPPTTPTTASPTDAPTDAPSTSAPTKLPTDAPSTGTPTTTSPTDAPVSGPTSEPTSAAPTVAPTKLPTDAPSTGTPTTTSPTDAPVVGPTSEPTSAAPTNAPTKLPTDAPSTGTPTTTSPTDAPIVGPTSEPTSAAPTDAPTTAPPVTDPPTDEPTDPPTSPPTSPPTDELTDPPTSPTAAPTRPPRREIVHYFSLHEDKSCADFTSAFIDNTGYFECMQICDNDGDCAGFSHENGNQCFLFATISLTSFSGNCLVKEYVAPQSPFEEEVSGLCANTPAYTMPAAAFNDCTAFCNSDPHCLAFQLEAETCEFFYETASQSASDPGCFVKNTVKAMGEFEGYRNTACGDNPIFTTVLTTYNAHSCYRACANNAACKSFDQNGGRCRLFDANAISLSETGTVCHSTDLAVPAQVVEEVENVAAVGRLRFAEAVFVDTTHNTPAFKTYMEDIILQSTGVNVTVFNVREGSVVVDFATSEDISADDGAFAEDSVRVAEATQSEGDSYQLGKQLIAAAEPYVPPPTGTPTTLSPTMAPVETGEGQSTDEPAGTSPPKKESDSMIIIIAAAAGGVVLLAVVFVCFCFTRNARSRGHVSYNPVDY